MKTYVIEYRLLFSDAIQDSIAWTFENRKMKEGEHGFVFDPMLKEAKSIFLHDLRKCAEDLDKFGRRNIIVNTCRLQDNWRKTPEETLFGPKFSIDDIGIDLTINPDKITALVDLGWKELEKITKKKETFLLINSHDFDAFDAINMLKQEIVGVYFVNEYERKFPLVVRDNNLKYARSIAECPPYVLQEIKTIMGVQSRAYAFAR